MSVPPIYDGLDALLQQRYADYPARLEPTWSRLLEQLHAVAQHLHQQTLCEPRQSPSSAAIATGERIMNAPVFVCGYYKSGTSLLLNLLDGHPELAVLPFEGKYFTGFYKGQAAVARYLRVYLLLDDWVRRLIMTGGKPPFWSLGRPDETHDPYLQFAHYLVYFADAYPEQDLLSMVALAHAAVSIVNGGPITTQARYWVEKTPTNEQHKGAILKVYPEARFLHILRDPRSILASMQKIDVERGTHQFNFEGTVRDLQHALLAAEVNQSHTCVLTYEALVSDTAGTMQRITDFLGIAYHPALQTPTTAGMNAVSNSAWQTSRVSGEIHAESLERWRQQLSSEQLSTIAAGLGPVARLHGYDIPLASQKPNGRFRRWVRKLFRSSL